MKKVSIALIAVVFMAFSPTSENNLVSNNTLKIENDITEFKELIAQKQQHAKLLELNAEKSKDVVMFEQANLLRTQCLKYEAAIACLERHLD